MLLGNKAVDVHSFHIKYIRTTAQRKQNVIQYVSRSITKASKKALGKKLKPLRMVQMFVNSCVSETIAMSVLVLTN